MTESTKQSDHHKNTAKCAKLASSASQKTKPIPPRDFVPFRAEARPGDISPQPEGENNELQIHIRITENGEICAWGLDQKGEEKIFSLTGNLDLINKYKAMSFNLCG